MNLLLIVLGVAGFLAALRRLVAALFSLFKGGVDAFLVGEVARSRADRGDVTGLQEARAWRRTTRRARMGALLRVVLWAVLLVVPLLTRITVPLYAAYAALWLPALKKRVAP
ncbi:MAG: hypothetical protein ACRENP_25560 [Longimicrobiales bacterium]